MVNIRFNYIKPIAITLVLLQAVPCLVKVNVTLQLILNSILSLVLACFLTVSLDKGNKKHNENEEKMTMKDAFQFPFIASAALCGLYTLYKILDPKLVTLIFKLNITLAALFAISNYLEEEFESLLFKLDKKVYYKLDVTLFNHKINKDISNHLLISGALASLLCFGYFFTNHWTLNNTLGIIFIVTGIKLVKIQNFKIVFTILWLLFFYDIFWVFGTDVMISVAKNLDAPIKLLLPYDIKENKFSMLGLGDIVIPGFFAVLCLKYDVDKYLKNNKIDSKNMLDVAKNIKIEYFWWCIAGYTVGIIVTNLIMFVFKHPQPALLYLVPGTTFSLLIKCFLDNSFKDLFSYEEDDSEENNKKNN